MKVTMRIASVFITITIFIQFLTAKPGDLDSSFGENGIVRTKVESLFTNHTSSIVLDNGNIIIASEFEYYMHSRGFQLLCYNPDGTLNNTFGNQGRVLTVCGYWSDYDYRYYYPVTIQLQNKNKILVAGLSVTGFPYSFSSSMLLIRYNLDGSIDSSFGVDGISKYQFTDRCNEILNISLQSDNKIIALAAIDTTSTDFKFFIFKNILVRFNTDGKIDSTFGINGIVDIDKIHIDEYKQPLVILEDNSIIIGGSIKVDEHYDYAICKYDKNGNLDLNFGQEGLTSIHFSEFRRLESSDILFFEENKLLISDNYYSLPYVFMGVGIIDTKGELQNDLGLNGKLLIQLPDNYFVTDVKLQQNNKILTIGLIWDTAFVIRLELDGTIDLSFGDAGFLHIPLYRAINVNITNNYLITTGFYNTPPSSLILAKILLDDESNVGQQIIDIENLSVSPNPASDYIEINLERWSPSRRWTTSEIQIYNSLGECVINYELRITSYGKERIDISALSPGLYFISINNGKKMLTGSFIVMR